MNKELFEALRMMEVEKGVPVKYLAEKIASAITVAARKDYGGKDVVVCEIDTDAQLFNVYLEKEVVEEIEDEFTQMTVEEAKKYLAEPKAGDKVRMDLDTKQFGRIVAQTAKHVIRQGVRSAEKDISLAEFQSHNKELVTAVVHSIDPKTGNAAIQIGRNEVVLPKTEQVPGEELTEGEHIKVYIADVKETEKGPKAIISRTHPGLVKRLFEMEVPEIVDGIIEIKSVSRQAGSRTKMAVWSSDDQIDAIGACIGQRGVRVNKIIEELAGEKIDIVRYDEDPAKFIAEALSPAKVVSVEIESEDPKVCRVTVPDSQLSLAIGNKGQNVRLAARLTGWKIDIRPESGYFEPSMLNSEEE